LYGVQPFSASNTDDWYFQCAKEGAWGRFWTQHERGRSSSGVAPLGPAAKHFLQRALDPNPRWRPSAAAMLDDPWLRAAAPGGNGPGDAELAGLMNSLGVTSPLDN
jgi:serine/threonine protein kinase